MPAPTWLLNHVAIITTLYRVSSYLCALLCTAPASQQQVHHSHGNLPVSAMSSGSGVSAHFDIKPVKQEQLIGSTSSTLFPQSAPPVPPPTHSPAAAVVAPPPNPPPQPPQASPAQVVVSPATDPPPGSGSTPPKAKKRRPRKKLPMLLDMSSFFPEPENRCECLREGRGRIILESC